MQDARIKAAINDFLRNVSHTALREIEKQLRQALADGRLPRLEDVPAAITVTSEKIGLEVTIHSRIEL